jgi:GT2 family glycosyltransferase
LLDYPAERRETIVVDDGSSTARDVVDRAELQQVILVEQTASGPAAARNRGADEAGGTFVAFLDDDCSPVQTWLADLQRALDDDPRSLVGGPMVNALTTNVFAAASETVVDYLVVAGRISGDEVSFLPSSNLALSREVFLALDGFDTRFTMAGGEDREFCERARASGHRLRFVESAVVAHRHDLGPGTFWRQHYRYGRGAYRLRRAQRDGVRKLVPERLSFYAGLVRSPQRGAVTRRRRALVASLLAVSQVATACGVIREALTGSIHPGGPDS